MQLISKQIQKIEKIFEDLKQESELNTTLILVEGRKDVESFYEFGISNNVAQFQGRSLTEVCDFSTGFKKIIILTDFDNYGSKMAKDLQQNLISRGLNADLTYYRRLKFYFKKVSKDFESLFKLYKQIKQKDYENTPK